MEHNDEFDRLIDEGLRRYAGAEPPLGLEIRVIAALQAKQRQRRWWTQPWLVAVPTAAVLAMVIGLSLANRTKPQPPAPQRASTTPVIPAPQPEPQVVAHAPERQATRRTAVQVSARAPNLEKFPAPEPVSQQETLLARLAQNLAAVQTVAARETESAGQIIISRITIDPIEIQPLPGPDPQGD
ncbi:MAG: hypothetical protein LAN37_00520 [Acidobacteriia bacterium]|nr:hypothetical protein [Terriglobia bacterium]